MKAFEKGSEDFFTDRGTIDGFSVGRAQRESCAVAGLRASAATVSPTASDRNARAFHRGIHLKSITILPRTTSGSARWNIDAFEMDAS